jgi:putative hydrolase of the HAD superfamily
MIKAIIFDCFGVVVSDTLQSAYESLGGDFEKDLPFIRQVLAATDRGEVYRSYQPIAEHLGVTVDTWVDALASGRKINMPLLEYVKELGTKYKVGMLSNVGKGRLPELFGEGFLEGYFDVVVASGDIGFAKPQARAYEYVVEQIGVRLDECVFTDDREEYIEGAQHVGMKTILFTSTEQFKKDLEALLNEEGM